MNWQVSGTTGTIGVFLGSYDELTGGCLELATHVNENSELTNKLLSTNHIYRDKVYCSFFCLNSAYICKVHLGCF